LRLALLLAALGTTLIVIAYPLAQAKYPPITDLPFHAAAVSILRHHGDPAFAFQQQFVLEPFAAYWTLYALGATFAVLLPITAAMKLALILMLASIPGGLAVLCHGMRKSPYLGLLGLLVVWNSLTYWGFINFVGAVGLFCMVVGVTFKVLEAPSRRLQVLLAILLVLVLETHVFRYPFALAAVFLGTVALFPATRRWKDILLPVVPSLLLFGLWVVLRDHEATRFEALALQAPQWERMAALRSFLFSSLTGDEERRRMLASLGAVAVCLACNIAGWFTGRGVNRGSPRERAFHRGTHLTVIGCGILFAAGYLMLPMEMGSWWGVFPREAFAALLVAGALFPDLPRQAWLRTLALAVIAWAGIRQALLVAAAFHHFQVETADFRGIMAGIPPAPRLGYMIFDRDDSVCALTPYVHLPAWVQAEKGGSLSFHFVSNNQSPIRYRRNSAAVPPPTPRDFEWNPQLFDVGTRGRFFDTFLVRSLAPPTELFAKDLSIRLVDHQGAWWLYHRTPAP
jgi:hypothetical protein